MNFTLSRRLAAVAALSFSLASINIACGQSGQAPTPPAGYLVAFHAITSGTVSADPPGAADLTEGSSLHGALLNGEPNTIYEGRWTTGQAVFIVRTSVDEAAELARNPALESYDVVAYFNAAPRGAAPEPVNVPPACEDPMLLLGFTRVTNADGNAAYSRAVVESNLPRLHGFVPLFSGRPVDLLRGTWPEGYTISTSIWPCPAAFGSFFYSRRYQDEIKPNRHGAGDYIIVEFTPEYDPR